MLLDAPLFVRLRRGEEGDYGAFVCARWTSRCPFSGDAQEEGRGSGSGSFGVYGGGGGAAY